MDKEESFGDKLQQSEEEFQRQFDPSHPLYHGGVQQVVPTGGERIPESMPTVYPEGYDPSQVPEVINYGPEYAKVEESRAVFQNIKKSLAKLGPIVEAFLRHEQLFRQKGDPTNQKHQIILAENIRKEKQALGVVQQELSAFIPELDSLDVEGKQVAKELFDLIKSSSKRYETKEELTDFNFKSKKLSTRVFALAQKCLQRLKDIKKAHAVPK